MESRLPLFNALHYLFSESGHKCVAHCLDLHIATSGSSPEEAEQKLNRLVQFQIATSEGNEGQLTNAAPLKYWTDFASGEHRPSAVLDIEVPPHIVPVERKQAIPVLRAALASAA